MARSPIQAGHRREPIPCVSTYVSTCASTCVSRGGMSTDSRSAHRRAIFGKPKSRRPSNRVPRTSLHVALISVGRWLWQCVVCVPRKNSIPMMPKIRKLSIAISSTWPTGGKHAMIVFTAMRMPCPTPRLPSRTSQHFSCPTCHLPQCPPATPTGFLRLPVINQAGHIRHHPTTLAMKVAALPDQLRTAPCCSEPQP